MDAREFKRHIANAPFTRVRIPPHSRPPLPDWVIDKMLEMEECGLRFAFDVHRWPLQDAPIISTHRPVEVSFKHQHDVQKALDAFLIKVLEIEGPNNALRGLKLAVMLGIENYLIETGMGNKEIPSIFFIYSGLLSQLLPIFLLEITLEERRYFWSDFKNELPQDNNWRILFCGALAMARLIYAFGHRADIWLPPVIYDLHLGGDLIIRTEKGTFYVQVKGRGGMGEIPFQLGFLQKSPTLSNPPSDWEKEMNKLWVGAKRFTEETGISVIPTVAEVDISGANAMWEIEEYPGLLSCATRFLDSL